MSIFINYHIVIVVMYYLLFLLLSLKDEAYELLQVEARSRDFWCVEYADNRDILQAAVGKLTLSILGRSTGYRLFSVGV